MLFALSDDSSLPQNKEKCTPYWPPPRTEIIQDNVQSGTRIPCHENAVPFKTFAFAHPARSPYRSAKRSLTSDMSSIITPWSSSSPSISFSTFDAGVMVPPFHTSRRS